LRPFESSAQRRLEKALRLHSLRRLMRAGINAIRLLLQALAQVARRRLEDHRLRAESLACRLVNRLFVGRVRREFEVLLLRILINDAAEHEALRLDVVADEAGQCLGWLEIGRKYGK